MPCWLQIAQGLLTPMIAIITTYIAWQQWKAKQLKMKMERYERRLKIYQETHRFISEVARELNPTHAQMFGFDSATAEADFIFPIGIRQYLDELFEHANQLHAAKAQYRDYTQEQPSGYDHKKVCEDIKRHSEWFINQPKVAKEKFKPFLEIFK